MSARAYHNPAYAPDNQLPVPNYPPFPTSYPADDAPQSSDDGSGLHSPVFIEKDAEQPHHHRGLGVSMLRLLFPTPHLLTAACSFIYVFFLYKAMLINPWLLLRLMQALIFLVK